MLTKQLKLNLVLLTVLSLLAHNAFAKHGHQQGAKPHGKIIEKTLNVKMKGQNLIKVKKLLGLQKSLKGQKIAKVMLIAASKKGKAKASLISGPSFLGQPKTIGKTLSLISFKLPKGPSKGKVQLALKGNIFIHKIVVKLKKGKGHANQVKIAKKVSSNIIGPTKIKLSKLLMVGPKKANKIKVKVIKLVGAASYGIKTKVKAKLVGQKGKVGKAVFGRSISAQKIILEKPTKLKDIELKLNNDLLLKKVVIKGIKKGKKGKKGEGKKGVFLMSL